MEEKNEKKSTEFTSELLLSDEEIMKLGVKKEDCELYRRKHYQNAFGIDTWYDKLEEHTFETIMIELSYDEAQAMVFSYLERKMTEDQHQILELLSQKIDALF